MNTALVVVFVLAYLAIALAHPRWGHKTVIALLATMGCGGWAMRRTATQTMNTKSC